MAEGAEVHLGWGGGGGGKLDCQCFFTMHTWLTECNTGKLNTTQYMYVQRNRYM